ncbi:MAG TPA: c-type cytochrome domain-containing protein, partial [Gemmata sp.]|nr:c-type cytochrome domain-containing protein [Gemmata sp.]
PTYWGDVRPILRKNCTECHSERKLDAHDVSGGLALDTAANILRGAEGGKVRVLVPGKPDESLIVTLLTSKDRKKSMPLDADPLSAADIATIRKWVAAGAPEGVKPKEDDTAAIATTTAKVRRLDVTFATRPAIPRAVGLPGPLTATLKIGPLPPVAAVAFSPDGKLLATGVYGRVTIWDLAAGKPAKVLTNVLAAVNDVKFSPDGKLLAVAGGQPSARGDLRLFDTKDWKLIHSLGGHLDTVSGVAFSPDGSKLASASFDKTVRLWDVKSGKVIHTFTGHSDFVYAVAFGPDGSWYATVSKDRTGRIVEAKTGKGLFTLSGAEQEVLAVAVRQDGQIATSGFETAVNWWDPKTAERVRRTGGPGVSVNELAFNAKGTVLAVAGGDGSVRFYDAKSGGALKSVQPGTAVFAVALDASGKRAASGSADGIVRVWDVAEARLLVTLCSGGDDNWLALTPEGYFAAAEPTLARIAWKADGKPVADTKVLSRLMDAGMVGKAARAEKIAAAKGK